MGNMDIHIGEMLARNARMYPDEIALIEERPLRENGLRSPGRSLTSDRMAFANNFGQRP